MASTFTTLSILISLALLFMAIDPSFAHREKKNKLKKICAKTSDRKWCVKVMKTDQRTSDADNRGLVDISIDLAYSRATDIRRDLNSLYDNSGEFQRKDRYNSCSKNYNDAIRNFDQIKRLLNDGDYKGIGVQIRDTIEEIRDCKNQLEKYDSDSSDLKKRTKEFEILCDFVRLSSKYLRGGDRDDRDTRDDQDD